MEYLSVTNHTHFSLQMIFQYFITKMFHCTFIMRIYKYEKNSKYMQEFKVQNINIKSSRKRK